MACNALHKSNLHRMLNTKQCSERGGNRSHDCELDSNKESKADLRVEFKEALLNDRVYN